MKKEVPLNKAKWLVEPGCVILVSGGTMDNANLMTFSWQTPVNTANPCLILLAVRHGRYTYELIQQNHELVINVPGEGLLEQTHLAGTITGRGIDKLARCGLTPEPSRVVQPPRVAECAGHLECRLSQVFPMDSHDLLVCEVVWAEAEADLFDGRWIPEKFHTLHYLNGKRYGLLTREVVAKE